MDCAQAQAVLCIPEARGVPPNGPKIDEAPLDIYDSVFELIDMRSFSNLWYWIVLAVMWSSASHWVLGVPYDVVQRARNQINRGDTGQAGNAVQDLEDLVRLNINRLTYISNLSGLWLMTVLFFLLSSLFTLGFIYQLEFSQALFLLLFPLSIVILLSVRKALEIHRTTPTGPALIQQLTSLRLQTQLIGMFSILVTSMWGMYQNISAMVLGI